MGCFVRGGKNGMGCFVRGDKNCMGCFVRGGKLMRDVLSGVAKMAWDVLSRDVLSYIPFNRIRWHGRLQGRLRICDNNLILMCWSIYY